MSTLLNDFIKEAIDPLSDDIYGPGYRCSVDLTDGTHLPCVILRRPKYVTNLTLKRFEEEKKKGKGIFRSLSGGYRKIVGHFVTNGNIVNAYDIKQVTSSRHAIPTSLLKDIEGETVMSWTGWVFEMNDGKKFSFGTTYLFEFFDLPEGFEFDDVAQIHNHSFLNKTGHIISIKDNRENWLEWMDKSSRTQPLHRERPYFTCYVE